MKNAFVCSSGDWTKVRKESVGLKVCQQKLFRLKCKRKTYNKKKKNRISKNAGKIPKDLTLCN